jgi:salicylate hydroxylase
MAAEPVLIAGAGIGGLTLALALLQRGLDVRIYEQSAGFDIVGAGVQLGPNGLRVLASLGVADRLSGAWVVPDGKELRLWNTGQIWPMVDLGPESIARYGHPYVMIHRGDLHAALVAAVRALKPDAISLGRTVTGCDQTDGRASLHFADGRATGRVVVGADGIHSVVRRTLFGDSRPSFTGYVAWRGLVPSRLLPPELVRPVMTTWVGPGGHIVHYLLRRGELFNFVAVVERSDWTTESWTQAGSPDQCAADFAGWHEDVLTVITRSTSLNKWALMSREPMERWSTGRCTLLGDACHPTLPFLAQGANMAIEDAAVMARCLADIDDAEEALARYEALRIERTSEIVRKSADNGRRTHNQVLSRSEDAEAYIAAEWSRDKVEPRYDWLYRYDALGVPIVAASSPTPPQAV